MRDPDVCWQPATVPWTREVALPTDKGLGNASSHSNHETRLPSASKRHQSTTNDVNPGGEVRFARWRPAARKSSQWSLMLASSYYPSVEHNGFGLKSTRGAAWASVEEEQTALLA